MIGKFAENMKLIASVCSIYSIFIEKLQVTVILKMKSQPGYGYTGQWPSDYMQVKKSARLNCELISW